MNRVSVIGKARMIENWYLGENDPEVSLFANTLKWLDEEIRQEEY
jgi:hypothetical protein